MPTEIFLANMTWEEARDRAKESGIAVLPVGSTEEHGYQIVLSSDAFQITEVARRACQLVADEVKPVIAPTVPYGVGAKMIAKDFPGTLFVSIDSMKHFVKDICETLAISGFRKILILDGHGGNPPAMVQVTKEVTEETGAACIYLFWKAVIPRETLRRIIETPTPYNHACEAETSVNLALGNRVLPERAVDAIPKDPVWNLRGKYDIDSGTLWAPGDLWKETNGTGVMGVPTKATKEKGQMIVDEGVKGIANLLRDLAKFPNY
jgi:creatinine amidohydrolase